MLILCCLWDFRTTSSQIKFIFGKLQTIRFTLQPYSEKYATSAANLAQHALLKLRGISLVAALFVSTSKPSLERFAPLWLLTQMTERSGMVKSDRVKEAEKDLESWGKDVQVFKSCRCTKKKAVSLKNLKKGKRKLCENGQRQVGMERGGKTGLLE